MTLGRGLLALRAAAGQQIGRAGDNTTGPGHQGFLLEPTEGWLRRNDDELGSARDGLFSVPEVQLNDSRLFHDPGSGTSCAWRTVFSARSSG